MTPSMADVEVSLVDDQVSSLERVLNVVRTRGFEIKFLLVDNILNSLQIRMRLENMPRGSHDFRGLECQLNNQLIVESVKTWLLSSPEPVGACQKVNLSKESSLVDQR